MDDTVKLTYLKPTALYDTEKPYYIFGKLPRGLKNSNLDYHYGPEQLITDLRGGRESEPTLSEHGFVYRNWPVSCPIDWGNEDDILSKYIPNVKERLLELLDHNAVRMETFDWRLRSAGSKIIPEHPGLGGMVKLPPADVVHIDQSPAGVLDWIHRELGSEADEIIKKYRVRVINVWRPLVNALEDMPLAMCDARTVNRSKLVEVETISDDYIRRNFMAQYDENFKFYYLSRMNRDEVCAFMVFDSATVGGKTNCTPPHGAFLHSEKLRKHVKPRESIEVRTLILSEYPSQVLRC